jgi:hypothetical protein
MITKAQCVEWIAALRSGKYRQGTGGLRRRHSSPNAPDTNTYVLGRGHSSPNAPDTDTYCCLGVLGNILVGTGGYVWEWEARPGSCYSFRPVGKHTRYTDLPSGVLRYGIQAQLMQMNDDKGADFPEIANYIERTILPELED